MSSPTTGDHPDHTQGSALPADSDHPVSSWRRPAVAFLLFDRSVPSDGEVVELLREVFDGSYSVDQKHAGDAPTVTIESVVVAAQPLDGPVGNGEPARFTGELAVWNGNEEVVDGHRSHIVIGAEIDDELVGDHLDEGDGHIDYRLEALRCELALAHVTAALTALPGAIAIYLPTAAATMPALAYRELVTANPIPVPALVGVRAGWFRENKPYVYTSGLGRFGRPDMERFADSGHPGELYRQMCDLVAFSLGNGVVFQHGQTLEVAEGEFLSVTAGVSEATGWQVLQLQPTTDKTAS